MGPLQWGDVPTWIGGTGALVAAWYAYQTITSQRQQIGEQRDFIAEQTRFMDEQRQNLELERAELRAAAEDRRWAQARQIGMGQLMLAAGNRGWFWRVTVHNKSEAPVHDLQVKFGDAYVAAEVCELSPTGGRGEARTLPLYILGSRRGAMFESQGWEESTAHNNRPTLHFTDDAGVRWSLDSYGKLQEAPDDAS